MIPKSEWKWYGSSGHLYVANDCRFNLYTEIGGVLVSTFGEYLPDADEREIIAKSLGVKLREKGDARRVEYLQKIGFSDIGLRCKYETMVFLIIRSEHGYGFPEIDWENIDFAGANSAREATQNHYRMCEKYASAEGAHKAIKQAVAMERER